MMIATEGRARQKTLTLARKAGVEVKAVVFTRPQLLKVLGYTLNKQRGTKRDRAWGRCWQDEKIIWLRLPVSVNTIAHEVMHLVTRASHNTESFNDKVSALAHGYGVPQHAPHFWEVTRVITVKYKVLASTAASAKRTVGSGLTVSNTETFTARSLKR